MFNENSVVVQAWVRQIKKEAVSREDIPNIDNLRDIVLTILDSEGVEQNV